MAFPAWAAAAIQGGAGAIGPVVTNFMNQKTDIDNKKFAERWYHQERKDNISDWNTQNQYNEGLWNKQNQYNEKIWHMMNDYNSPENQMKRFKQAGLNPNLIYGQQNMGGSISTSDQRTTNLQGSNMQSNSPMKYDFDTSFAGDALQTYLQYKEKGAVINNLEKQNQLLSEEIGLKSLQSAINTLDYDTAKETKEARIGLSKTAFAKAQQDLTKSMFDYNLESELRDTSVDFRKQQLQNAKQDFNLNQIKSNRDSQLALSTINSQSVQSALGVLQGRLLNEELDLRKLGGSYQDNLLFRILMKNKDNILDRFDNFKKYGHSRSSKDAWKPGMKFQQR